MALLDYYDLFKDLIHQPTTEDSGEAVEEIEYIFFLKLDDFEQLERLAKYSERQEQWSLLFRKQAVETVVRVRRINAEGSERFVLTSKINFPELDGKWELEQDAERIHFDIVKENADSGMIKRRYFFPIDGTDMIWEVDVFYDENGEPVEWVKVDLEVQQRLGTIPTFPIEYVDSVEEQPEVHTDAQKRLVRGLFRDHYIIKV